MKTIYLLLATCVLFSCGPANTPRGIAEAFFTCMKNNDMEKAAKFCTSDAAMILMAAGSQMPKDENPYKGKLIFESENIDGNEAKVIFKKENGKIETVNLKLVDGKWKVSLKMGK